MVALIQIMCTVLQTPDQTYLRETDAKETHGKGRQEVHTVDRNWGCNAEVCRCVETFYKTRRLAMYPGETGRSIGKRKKEKK